MEEKGSNALEMAKKAYEKSEKTQKEEVTIKENFIYSSQTSFQFNMIARF
jgi:hypothetical protein